MKHIYLLSILNLLFFYIQTIVRIQKSLNNLILEAEKINHIEPKILEIFRHKKYVQKK